MKRTRSNATPKDAQATSDNLPAKPSSAPKYIPLSKFMALIDKGLDDVQIGAITGCSKQAVQQRRKRLDIDRLKEYKDNKSLHMTHLQHRLVNSLTDPEITKMSPYQRVIASAIIEDKFMPKAQAPQVLNLSLIVQQIDDRRRKIPQHIVDLSSCNDSNELSTDEQEKKDNDNNELQSNG